MDRIGGIDAINGNGGGKIRSVGNGGHEDEALMRDGGKSAAS
ncbi:hypothetical protein [Paraburkholderia kururiensis]|nr:hypothetical protein [Paraburkholderia kururiensis]